MEPHYAPRTIAFQSEILHPLVEADPARLQRLHNHLFEAGHPPYSDFSVLQDGVLFSNPASRPGAISSVAISGERLLFREELTAMTVDEFAARVRRMSEQVCELLGIQVLTAHQVTLRTLANPRHFTDSRDFIKSGMFGFSDETDDFGREPQLLGLRLVFPPSEGEPNAHALRIESFHNDPRSVFLENQASFPPLLTARGLAGLERNVMEAYEFLLERGLSFVSRFDVRLEA
jgi:hypothetical protein